MVVHLWVVLSSEQFSPLLTSLKAALLAVTPVPSQSYAEAEWATPEVIDLLREKKTRGVYDPASLSLICIEGTEPQSVECFERHRNADVRRLRVSSFRGRPDPLLPVHASFGRSDGLCEPSRCAPRPVLNTGCRPLLRSATPQVRSSRYMACRPGDSRSRSRSYRTPA